VEGNVIGVVPWFPEVANKKVQPGGRFITDREMRDKLNVCVISQELAERLFLFHQPVGQDIKVKDDYYRIIGIMEPEQGSKHSNSSRSSLLNVYIPLTAAKFRIGDVIVERQSGNMSQEKVELHQLTIKVMNSEAVEKTARIIDGLLKRHHKKADYEIVVPLELLQKARRTQRIFSIVLGSIAAISLLVGGIGIMNIMLATVTERTREIGIRRALGAKKRDIVLQFLAETTLLSGFGGAIGVLIGVAIPFFIERFAQMSTIIKWWCPAGAFGISLLIGVIFGLYPAWRAAQMNPIAALRHE
jgi:putative ABC transport system permease protein